MKSIAFFNNKGGVGKTTLACNIASHIAVTREKRVLLVDCDPQCNSTQLILQTDRWMPLYWQDRKKSSQHTIIDLLQPIEDGDAGIKSGIKPVKSSLNRFTVDILPGHPRMSIIEDLLSRAWSEAIGGEVGGIRKTNWVSSLITEYEDNYDLIVFDVGPSLGSLNRTVLIGADYFATPMGADIFSIVGVRNIAEWLDNWLSLYGAGLGICDTRNPNALAKFGIDTEVKAAHGFVGYTVQQYITKSKRGVRRPTQAFERVLSNIPAEIEASLGKFTADHLDQETVKLGDVPNMYSLIPLAQSVNAPIARLKASDGLAGGAYQQQAKYLTTIRAVGDALARNIGIDGY